MPAYHVDRSVKIDAPLSKVRPAIEDFSEWPKWSPWLCMEPTAKVDVFGTPGQPGHGYDWDGDLVGAGGMTITANVTDAIDMDLTFLRPFKSNAKVKMETKAIGEDQTEVIWHMDGKMPFFLFFMIGMMKTFIGMDFSRGLKMLKEYVETGSVKSQTDIVGIVDVPQIHYVAVEAKCTMDEIGESMKQTLPAAFQCAKDNQLEIAGPPGALYHNVNMKDQRCHYSAFVSIASPTEVSGAGSGTIQPCRALKVVHTGSYHHLGNAWSAVMSYQRHKKLKPSKSQCGFELYPNDPHETPEEDWRTEIYIPLR